MRNIRDPVLSIGMRNRAQKVREKGHLHHCPDSRNQKEKTVLMFSTVHQRQMAAQDRHPRGLNIQILHFCPAGGVRVPANNPQTEAQ